MHEFMREFAHEFVAEFFSNFVREFKYEIRTNSYEFFARKIGYVTNDLYCMIYLVHMNYVRCQKSDTWASYSIQNHEGKYSV